MLVIELGITTEVSPLQPPNACSPMFITEFGIVNVPVSPLQASNAYSPMLVTPLPIVTDVSPLQFLNA
jgi:hypothetical protein